MNIQAESEIIAKVLNRLVSKYDPLRVYLFGSYASGHPDADSDIDLLIIKDTEAPFFDRLTQVRQAVSGTHSAVPFDPIVLTTSELEERSKAGDQFILGILESGQLVYAQQ